MKLSKIYSTLGCTLLISCGGGGSSHSGFIDKPEPPSAFPTEGSYGGVPYSQLSQPTGFSFVYPNEILPKALQIAYGYHNESTIANLTAHVAVGSGICSATPIKYDSVNNNSFLISAAHCFVHAKSNAQTVTQSDIVPNSNIFVHNGVTIPWKNAYIVKAVYIPQNFCYNSTYNGGGKCPNFSPNSGVETQGNDIAIIQIKGKYANPESYPLLVEESQYPQTYTMAPILSIGYGFDAQFPNNNVHCSAESCHTMHYVANYQYWKQDAIGYHYLYNSYYANNSRYGSGYAAMFCEGDSGGGDLFWNGHNWLLLSEHTYGPTNACGTLYSFLPNAATNVAAYLSWIRSIIDSADPVGNCKSGEVANCITNVLNS